ncbi:biotin/lipoyl-binding protein [Chitinophaga oryziterrae]|uniref:Dihydrolipoamide acetyltransferase component of pyruvate dehydrogenase complex n=1 Tax=Chitinophaga oryziterrae TaxID=1031224 RepID=A0A6N8JJY9_9BACT|nr:dihydrolipoamide acetyltransferase family protein [Chitinophaga oryziterrae]MVT44568.1 biotin/lipoyl-binding protein [Chitinophaga oryziterrae]
MIEFTMPSLGADMEAGTLMEWLVKPGDHVKRGDIIATVDTQKGLIDIEVFDTGIVNALLIKVNEKVPVGTKMALIATDKEAPVPIQKQPPGVERRIRATPLAKKMAADKGIDLSTIKGTGEGGAITHVDVEKVISGKIPPEVHEEEEKTGAAENIRMAVAAAMSKSNREIPHYYLDVKVDMSKALAWLTEANKQRTVKLRLLPVVLLVKAVAKALKEVPDLNGYWENGLSEKQEINIGFVVSLRKGGVMIPAIHDADKKNVDELMTSLNDIIPRARAMKLRSSELSESTFTISSLGEGNADTVYGVIYPPQVALAGFGSITEQPWAESGMLDVRPVMNITLSADHRATDGATGSRFLMIVKKFLENPELLVQ